MTAAPREPTDGPSGGICASLDEAKAAFLRAWDWYDNFERPAEGCKAVNWGTPPAHPGYMPLLRRPWSSGRRARSSRGNGISDCRE
jgi:hypothetical protein